MINVSFYARGGYVKLFAKIACKLSEHEITSSLIVQNDKEEREVRKICKDFHIYNLTRYLMLHWDECGKDNIAYWSNKYNVPSIWNLFYTDRALNKYSYEDSCRFVDGHFRFYEQYFSDERPMYFINEPIAFFSPYVAFHVGKFFNCQYLGLMIGRTDTLSHFYFTQDPMQKNPEMEEILSKKKFSTSHIEAARKYIKSFRETTIRPAAFSAAQNDILFKLKHLKMPVMYFQAIFSKMNWNRIDYLNYRHDIYILFRSTFLIRYFLSKKYYTLPNFTEKYILFPLHYQPEASTLVCAQKYEKQLYTIDQLAKNIPSDTLLYVKEHYTFLGHRPLNFYKELKKYPNVRLISPHAQTQELIKHSEFVICLTSSVGWEAMLHKKPVVFLGNIFFDNEPGTLKLDDISKLNSIMPLIKELESNEEEIVNYLAGYFASLKIGRFYYIEGDKYYTSDENVKNISMALANKVRGEKNQV